MRVLLLGAGGMLARDVIAEAPQGAELIVKSDRELDVTREPAVAAALAETQPEVIINCAAYTNVDGAESEPERAFAANGNAPGIIGRAASAPAHRSLLTPLVLHFSSDYVFDGQADRAYREGDRTGPLGRYGASKLAGERALAESGAFYLIVRTSWLFGVHGRSFPRTMWERAVEGKATRVVNDQLGRPTFTVDLARAVWGLLEKREAGRGKSPCVLHVANSGFATWYDVAKRVFQAAGVPDLLSPCATSEYPTPARRPANSTLDTSRYETLTGGALPAWTDALDRFLALLQAEVGSER